MRDRDRKTGEREGESKMKGQGVGVGESYLSIIIKRKYSQIKLVNEIQTKSKRITDTSKETD